MAAAAAIDAASPTVAPAAADTRFDPAPAREGVGPLPAPRPRGPEFRRGVALGLFVSDADPTRQRAYYAHMLDEIAATGATDLQVVVRWAQADVRASTLAPDPVVSTPDTLLRWVVGAAHARRLRVMLLPIVHLEQRAAGAWRGTLAPTDRAAWWRSYRTFVLHHAGLAAELGVADLAVGSELVSMERDEAEWRALLTAVRAVYRGRLTYSANWDHFEPLRFADALDVLGVTAYAPLVGRADPQALDPDEARLVAGGRGFRARVRAWAATHDKPVLLTEVGWPALDTAALRPWDYGPGAGGQGAGGQGAGGPARPELQGRLYRAFYRLWQGEPRLAGVYFWNWFGVGGPEDLGYSPRGREAEAVLRRWFAAPRE